MAFAASLLVPGAGQATLGLKRWALYGLAEVALWVVGLEARAEEEGFRDGYRDLAWEVARIRGSSSREDGSWGYYEAMSHYMASGSYDRDPVSTGLQPELDESTYNGVVWKLARQLYLGGSGEEPGSESYDLALDYYRGHAAGPSFLWSWAGSEDQLTHFRNLIDRSDAEARLATRALGLVLANHLTSAVDALIVARLREGEGVRLRSRIERDPTAHLILFLEIPVR